MDRLWVRGRENVHKKLLIQAAACNLALLLRASYGSGKPKAAHDRKKELIWGCVCFLLALFDLDEPGQATAGVAVDRHNSDMPT